MNYIRFALFFLFALVLVNCTDPSVIGGNLVEDDIIKLEYKNDINIKAKTIAGDSIITYQDSAGFRSLLRYLVGNVQDPIFGNSEAITYGQFRLEAENKSFPEYFIDSVYLSLIYSEAGFYGDTSEMMDIEIFELSESLTSVSKVYSNETFDTDPMPIGGAYGIVPDPNEPFLQIDSSGEFNDTIELASRLRIKVDNSFGAKVLDLDEKTLGSNELFLEAINGIAIKANSGTNRMVAFDFLNPETQLSIYFKADNENQVFNLIFSNESVKIIHYKNDVEQSVVGNFIGDEVQGDSLLFLQGNSGVNIEFQFPDINELENVLVNSAHLEMVVAELSGDDLVIFNPMKYLNIKYKNSEGNLIEVPDKVFSDILTGFDNDAPHFGGILETWEDGPQNLYRYRINLSTYIQELIEISEVPTLFIQSRLQPIDASRTIIYGPGHSIYPMNLRMTYTRK